MPKLNSLKNQELSKTIDLSTMTARNTIDERHRNKNILSKKKSRYENYSSLEKPK